MVKPLLTFTNDSNTSSGDIKTSKLVSSNCFSKKFLDLTNLGNFHETKIFQLKFICPYQSETTPKAWPLSNILIMYTGSTL